MAQAQQKKCQSYQYIFEIDGILLEPFHINSLEDFKRKELYERAYIREDVIGQIESGMIKADKCKVTFISTYLSEEVKKAKETLIKTLISENCDLQLFKFGKEEKTDYLHNLSNGQRKDHQILIDTSWSSVTEWKKAGGLAVQVTNQNINYKIWNQATIDLSNPFTAYKIYSEAVSGKSINRDSHDRTLGELKCQKKERNKMKA